MIALSCATRTFIAPHLFISWPTRIAACRFGRYACLRLSSAIVGAMFCSCLRIVACLSASAMIRSGCSDAIFSRLGAARVPTDV